MRKNRKRTKMMSKTAVRSMRFGAVIMSLCVMVVINILADLHCGQTMKAIGDKEKDLKKLERDYERENTKWGNQITPEKLDWILTHLGMSMKYPRPEQIVRMDARGVPEPGQISVARALRRRSDGMKGQASNEVKPRTKPSRKRR